jgi:23S rRNA (uracil1939-C5)-methyltransferase
MNAGDRLTLRVEKPAAGGRMIARHQNAVVLVSGAIPGELVDAEIEKVQRGTAWARTRGVLDPSPDRVVSEHDGTCGGNVFAHIRYQRQTDLKREIIRDAFTRIGRMQAPEGIAIAPSPVDGYRMRARLHVVDRRVGFFREGTHQLCDAAATGQLLPSTVAALQALEAALRSAPSSEVVDVEVSENCPANQRAVHLVLREGAAPSRLGSLPPIGDLTGLSCGSGQSARGLVLWGTPEVTDTMAVPAASGEFDMTLTRHVQSFFQGNRFLLPTLVAAVADVVPAGRVLDLYAGVGLFSVALARRGDTKVTAVEGDRTAARDLKTNTTRAGGAIEARHQPVEVFLGSSARAIDTVIVDPPRTGMTRAALTGVVALTAARVVYISCDVATLGRDARLLVDAGYRLGDVRALDLFPNTAHVETIAVFDRKD